MEVPKCFGGDFATVWGTSWSQNVPKSTKMAPKTDQASINEYNGFLDGTWNQKRANLQHRATASVYTRRTGFAANPASWKQGATSPERRPRVRGITSLGARFEIMWEL